MVETVRSYHLGLSKGGEQDGSWKSIRITKVSKKVVTGLQCEMQP